MDDTAKGFDAEASGVAVLPNLEYLSAILKDAELLVAYAAESGIELDPRIGKHVLHARIAEDGAGWTPHIAQDLLSAITALSAKLRPVTVESLRLFAKDRQAKQTLRAYKWVVVALAFVIIPFSFATFVASRISQGIDAELVKANALAVTASNSVSPLPDTSASRPEGSTLRKGAADALQRGISEAEVIRNLQEFAASTRAIYSSARELNWFVGYAIADPYAHSATDDYNRVAAFELPPGLPDLVKATTDRIAVYQGIRYFAQSVQGYVATIYGAFSACVLPVLYALLGACAYLLRLFEEQLRTRTLTQTDGHVAHFVVAAISGAVIGLFSNLNFGQGASLSPLAVAFLVGYAVDVFFSFLEGMIQSVSKTRGERTAQAASRAPSPQPD
jgi:hypothetical protein